MLLDQIHRRIGSIYRFVVAGIAGVYAYRATEGTVDASELLMYGMLFMYALCFSLMGVNKWIAYLELLAIGALHYYYQEQHALYFLLLIPIADFVSVRTNLIDRALFPAALAGLYYLYSEQAIDACVIGIGLYFTFSMFQVKFNQIESLEKEIRVEKGNTDEKRMDLSEKLRDLDVLNRMLEQIRRLNESYETKVIIEQLAEGTLKLFESNYACLYIRREQYFEKFSEAGRNDRHEVPETISFEEGMKPQMDNKMMRIPIMYEEKVWGIIAVYDKKSILGQGKQKVLFPFEELDLDVLVLYLQQAMIKLSHTNLIAEMKSMALIDPLTGLDNRRAFNDKFKYLVERAARGDTLTVMVIDVDHFKQFNDRFGHEVGDEVLRVVGETIKDSVRKVDIVARWGGEEFAVLLPNASGNAEIIGERIRRNIKSIEFQIPITVSVGVAFYGAHGTEEKELLGNADKATYYAKQHGRDQVVIYSEEIG